jgi:hypothetical protein
MIDELAVNEESRRWLPGFSSIPPERFLSPERLVSTVVAIAAGVADHLSGRLLVAWDDVERVAADAERVQREDLRVLRITGPY